MTRVYMSRPILIVLSGCALAIGASPSAGAATICVGPRPGCYSTIVSAVAAASPGDQIEVAQGVYHEDVVIGKSLSLIGKNRANTIVDATGLANGIYIDGLDNPGLNHVTVSGFTIRNANFEGVLITNAAYVTLNNNRISGNDRGLDVQNFVCPGLPDFETAEDVDCGEAVHVAGLDHSMLSNNVVENNAGGFLISDETGPTHDNVITDNVVRNNVFDCGITIPTHPRAPQFGGFAQPPFGIWANTISANRVSGNGVQGEGAGVGLFGFLPGGRVSDNVVTGNVITNNGLPGIAVHAHSPGLNFDNNVFVGNYIARNGEDTDDAETPGPTGINIYSLFPIFGNVVAQNVIKSEAVDVVFHIAVPAGPTPHLDAHRNNLNGQGIGIDNIGVGAVDAANNWWGCANGPAAPGCSTVEGAGVVYIPFLTSPAVPNGSPTAQR